MSNNAYPVILYITLITCIIQGILTLFELDASRPHWRITLSIDAHAMAELPPGFRFYPTEEELVCFYLRSKLDGRRSDIERVIPVADVCALDPGQLPGTSISISTLGPMVRIAEHFIN
jgi:hypothetical protein